MYFCFFLLITFLFAAVVIGFVQTMYSEPESAGTIRLEVEVKQGSLAKPIGVIFSTADNTATGMK